MNIRDIVNRDIVNLTNCEQEPIHVPGSIQPHGFLFGLSNQTLNIEYCSGNTEQYIQKPHSVLLGKTIGDIFGDETATEILDYIKTLSAGQLVKPLQLMLDGKAFIGHINKANDIFILEAEPVSSLETLPDAYHQTQQFLHYMEETRSLQELCASVARGTREITGYDRVMIYRFDEEYNGEIFAESKREDIEPFLGLHYPHTDIPAQARELYMRNVVRVISDINYVPVPIYTIDDGTGKSLDLSLSILRSTSPIHVEYLRNMGVGATLTISLIHNNRLWGLIACHHYSAKNIPHTLRIAAQLQGHFITSQIGVRQSNEEYEVAKNVNEALQNLLSKNFEPTYGSFTDIVNDQRVLQLCNASGVCISVNGKFYKGGKTPCDDDIRLLLTKLSDRFKNTGFHTHHLAAEFSEAENICETAAGIIYYSLSLVNDDCIIWFRAETLTEIHWGGDPSKAIIKDENGLHPRKSFQLYKEQVKCKSKRWLQPELNAAANYSYDLQKQVSLLVITEEEERYRKLSLVLKENNAELENINWISTHDLQEPLRKIQMMASRVLEEPTETLSETSVGWIRKMSQSAGRMQTLLKDILIYTQIQQPGYAFSKLELNSLIETIVLDLDEEIKDRNVEVKIDQLPQIVAVPSLIKQLFINLISNALKFTSENRPQVITIKAISPVTDPSAITSLTTYHQIVVSDTGIGFQQEYADSIFKLFTRLNRGNDFQGSGVGLALCKKIMQKHKGFITASGIPNEGAAFNLFFPIAETYE